MRRNPQDPGARRAARSKRAARTAALGLALLAHGCAAGGGGMNAGDLLHSAGFGAAAPLDESTVAAGLKEALRVGTERTVAATSRQDGFWGNSLIRIPLPGALDGMAGALRTVGMGSQLDELELAMNRAAESASREAGAVFWDAITRMTLGDAFEILNGGDTSATDYFREHTSEELRSRFRPIVSERMQQVGVYRLYDPLLRRYSAIPLTSKPVLDLEGYVTQKALDGLFTVLAGQEQAIRADPAARSTELLRRVFGSR